MGNAKICRRNSSLQLSPIYPIGDNGRPFGEVMVTEKIDTISSYVFQENDLVTSIDIRPQEATLEKSCFKGCVNLSNIILPEKLQELPEYCFSNCSSLTTITVPDTVQTLGNSCFRSSGIETITIPDGVEQIPLFCFDSCSKLNNVNIPNSVTTFNKDCFANTPNLTEITLPNSLNTIGMYGLRNTNFQKINIPEEISEIYCGGRIMSYSTCSNEAITAIASKMSSNSGIGNFQSCAALTEVTINYLCGEDFEDCNNLEKCTILNAQLRGDGEYGLVPSGKRQGFISCSKLHTIILPDGLTVIDTSAFYVCTALQNINLPSTLLTIEPSAFGSCSSLTEITLPKSLISIKESAFSNSGLTDVIVESTNKIEVLRSAFAGCVNLTNESVYNISQKFGSINAYIFKGCTSLTDVTVSRLWNGMFQDCTNLVSLTSQKLGSSGKLGAICLKNCSSLKNLTLPKLTVQDTNLTTTNEDAYCFSGCTALENIVLGTGWSASVRFDVSENLTAECMVNMFESLANLTDSDAQTLTLGAVNLAKLTEEQIAVATNKNWIIK